MAALILQFLHEPSDGRVAIFAATEILDGAAPILSEDEFDLFRTELSNISRRILIVSSEAEAVAVHRSMAEDVHDAVVTELGEEGWALSVSLIGQYDSGVPFIEDLRSDGVALEIEGNWVDIHPEDSAPRRLSAAAAAELSCL